MHRGQFEEKLDFKKIWKLYFGSKKMNLKCLGLRKEFANEIFLPDSFSMTLFKYYREHCYYQLNFLQWNVREM